MARIGLLEGFAPTGSRVRPPILLGDLGLIFLGFNPAIDTPTNPGEQEALKKFMFDETHRLMTSVNPNTGKNYTYQEALNSVRYARSMRNQAVSMREANRLREKEQFKKRKVAPTAIQNQTLIDDYQGQYPSGGRGASGSVPGKASFSVIPDATEPKPTGIDTRGQSTGAFAEGSENQPKKSALPILAVAAAAWYILGG